MKPLVPAAILAAFLAAAAPARAEGPPRRCPEALRDVSLVARTLGDGIVLELTSERPRAVAELRGQLREAAMVLERRSKARFRTAEPGAPRTRTPPLEISVNDVGAGAHVIIRAQRARDLPEILDLVQALEATWSRSACGTQDLVAGSLSAPIPGA